VHNFRVSAFIAILLDLFNFKVIFIKIIQNTGSAQPRNNYNMAAAPECCVGMSDCQIDWVPLARTTETLQWSINQPKI
jgi:hypothetical protein